MNSIYKNESFVLFSCILLIIVVYFIYSLYNFLCKYLGNYQKYNSYNKNRESFGSKRDKMIKIFKDETGSDIYDANTDPDSTDGQDPDS